MPDRPYTDEDLRIEAARQHAALTKDPDFMGVGEQMEDQEVTPGGEVTWDDFSSATHDAAQRSIHDLITGAADTSTWAVALGADGLEPSDGCLTLNGGDKAIARIHFAFDPDMPDEMRESLIEGVGSEIARYL